MFIKFSQAADMCSDIGNGNKESKAYEWFCLKVGKQARP